MKKNRIVLGLGILALASIMTSFDVQDNSGQAGKTGSPGETTCVNNCHNSYALNDGTGSVTITSDIPNWEYMTGDTYNIDVTVTHIGSTLFGLGVECLDGSSPNLNAGVLIITNTAETQIKNATISSILRKNVVHKLNGGVGTDSKTFSFKWAAPTTNIGNVTFYVAGNGANGDNNKLLDHIYTTSQVVTPAFGASVADVSSFVNGISLYPNPAHESVTVSYNTIAGENIEVSLISVDGKTKSEIYSGKGDGQKHEVKIALPENLAAGVYLVKMINAGEVSVSRLVVQ